MRHRLEEEDAAAAALASSSAHSSDIPSDSALRPRRRTSLPRPAHEGDSTDDDEVASTLLRKPDWAHLASADSVLASAATPGPVDQDEDAVMAVPDGREDEDADLEENGDDEDDVDGAPVKLDSTTVGSSTAPSRSSTSSVGERNAAIVAQALGASGSDVDKAGDKLCVRTVPCRPASLSKPS
mgnify:FL=1